MAKEEQHITEVNTYSFEDLRNELLDDYRLACVSREASLLGRKEVLTGKAKFGIFGDGKEIAQIALAKTFRDGDFRSGYYRDQTFMMAIGALTVQQFFAQLYAHTDTEAEPASVGRQMNGHFATRSLHGDGTWKDLTKQKNSSADLSPTASQMPRLVGLAQASKVYRNNPQLDGFTHFSQKGNEVAFGTIGDASTSEGIFWESMNAATVLQVPMVMSVWDDGFGISVPKKYQTTKESISEALAGFQRTEEKKGIEIFKARGWNYAELVSTYSQAVRICREQHVPVLVHVEDMTQPQGHSTSGSHERYKTPEQLQWGLDFDPIKKFGEWILEQNFDDSGADRQVATKSELDQIAQEAKKLVREAKAAAWKAYSDSIKQELTEVGDLLSALAIETGSEEISKLESALRSTMDPMRKDIVSAVRRAMRHAIDKHSTSKQNLIDWLRESNLANHDRYSSYLHSNSAENALSVKEVLPTYDADAQMVDGRIVLRDNFEALFNKYPELLTFGEDTGKIGGVNQSMEGMQEKFGEIRVSDTGIREATIIGQGIGLAMRGLRPIAEIQYLDYLLYGTQILSDDLATLQYRTKGGQKAPLIVRTRGHRLEGVWHSGSPMGGIVNLLRGIYVCVPRNMNKAAGMYNTLLKGDDPAIVVEPLNGYRTKEPHPTNLGEFTVPIGVAEVVKEGTDITVVSYGSTFNLCGEAARQLEQLNISVELIDVQTLLPLDINHTIAQSVSKTNRLLVVDEDVPGGASAYILQQVLDEQSAFQYLDSAPQTLSAKAHRPAYGSDGDYFSKPNLEDIFDAIYAIMHEADPGQYPQLY